MTYRFLLLFFFFSFSSFHAHPLDWFKMDSTRSPRKADPALLAAKKAALEEKRMLEKQIDRHNEMLMISSVGALACTAVAIITDTVKEAATANPVPLIAFYAAAACMVVNLATFISLGTKPPIPGIDER